MAMQSGATYLDWQQWPEGWLAQGPIDRVSGELDMGRMFAESGNAWLGFSNGNVSEGGATQWESGSPVIGDVASTQDGSESVAGVSGSPMYWQFSGYEAAPYTSLDILTGPSPHAASSGHRLQPGDTFVVDILVEGGWSNDAVSFLRLADGRGWVYDRSPKHGVLCVRLRANRIVLPRSPPTQQVLASDWLNSAALETQDPAPKSTPQDRTEALDNPKSGLTPTRRRNKQRAMRRIAIKKLNGTLSPQGGEVKREGSGSEPEGQAELSYWQFVGYEGNCKSSRLPFFTGPSRKVAASDNELAPGDTFAVDKVKAGEVSVCSGTVLFLRLADGRGWVCDRSPKHGIVCVRVEADSIGQKPLARQSTASDWLTLAAAGAKAIGQRDSAPKPSPQVSMDATLSGSGFTPGSLSRLGQDQRQDYMDATSSSSAFAPGSLSRLGQDQPIVAPSMTRDPALPIPFEDSVIAGEAAQWLQGSWADDCGPVAAISGCDLIMLRDGALVPFNVAAANLEEGPDVRCTVTLELFGEVWTGKLLTDGSLLWHSGDVWQRW